MEAMAIYNRGAIAAPAAREITTALFNDFVAFVDRSERTTKNYLMNLKQFIAWLKYSDITQPARQDVISYREWLQSEHDAITFDPASASGWAYRTDRNGEPVKISCRANTVKLYLQSVKQFFKWTATVGAYPNIAENIHTPKTSATHKKDSFSAADVVAIENSITAQAAAKLERSSAAAKDPAGRIQRSTEQGKRLYAMYLLAVNAGLRTIELSRANINDIETKGGQSVIYIWGKGRSEADQRKPIAPEVMGAIADYLNSRTDAKTGSSPLFISTGNRSGGKRIAATTISTMLKQAMRDAGYNSDRLTAHSLRHTAAANVMQLTGNNIYTTQQYLRHASPATTEIYLENDNAAQDAAIAAQLYKHYHGTDDSSDSRQRLDQILAGMNPEQLQQLAGIAAAIVK